ncbi:MAG: prepilin-type N-terminal cleavage/methylation domain-containing protein [Candidatus Dojkabacteria bacterium]
MEKTNLRSAFTLIEVLVVVALVAILASITFIAINPAKNFSDARNAQRSSDVSEILSAITQYTSESGHAISDFANVSTCATTTAIGTTAGFVNLSTLLVDSYIVGIPTDPSVGTALNTGYTICKTATGRITVAAPSAENGKSISVKR